MRRALTYIVAVVNAQDGERVDRAWRAWRRDVHGTERRRARLEDRARIRVDVGIAIARMQARTKGTDHDEE